MLSNLSAEVRYVDKKGSNTPPYLNWQTAAINIQDAVNYSGFGDTIFVANGFYTEKINMKAGISLIGGGIDSCIIDPHSLGNNDVRTITMESDCSVQNFCIRSFSIDSGYCIESWNKLNVFVNNNRLERAHTGIYPTDSKIVVSHNIITDVGNGIQLAGLTTYHNQIIENNIIYPIWCGIILLFGTNPIIHNNIIYLNDEYANAYVGGNTDMVVICNNLVIAGSSHFGITPASNRATLVYNNVLIGNFTVWALGAWNMDVLKNNMIINSSVGICSETGEKPVVQYNAAWNTRKSYYKFIPDSTNIIADPMLVNMNEGDYHLQKFSPLIDAGDPGIYDKDGSRSDVGLYGGPYGESYTYQDLAPQPPKNLKAELDSNRITLCWKKNTEADFSYYRIYSDTLPDFTYDATKLINEITDTLYSEVLNSKANRYYYKLTAVDSSGNQSVPGEEISVLVTAINTTKLYANDYKLFQNYPNPFNPSTTISYRLKESGYVKLSLYDIKGERIAELINKEQPAGYYELSFNPSLINKTFAAGVYVYTLTVQDVEKRIIYSSQKKMLLLK